MDVVENKPKHDEDPKEPQSYQMRPKLEEMFKSAKIKDLMINLMQDTLKGKTYNSVEAAEWTKTIADGLNQGIKDLAMKRYKHVVQVAIGQQLGSGYKFAACCRWDAECDCQTSEVFSNASLFCICTVFGIYLY